MTFDEKLAVMQTAQAQAETAFINTVASARDAYVLAGTGHVEAETAWLNNPANQTLQDAAAVTWAALTTARTGLLNAVTSAASARQASLNTAWNSIKGEA